MHEPGEEDLGAKNKRFEDPFASPFNSLLIADLTIQDVLRRTFGCLHSKNIDSKLNKFSVLHTTNILQVLCSLHESAYDRGEKAGEGAFHEWCPSPEPVCE